MKALRLALLLGAAALTASAEIIALDQIGPSSSFVATDPILGYPAGLASQYYEPSLAAYRIGALDDFTTPSGSIRLVEAVVQTLTAIGVSNDDLLAHVTNWQVAVFSGLGAAATSLVGDVANASVSPADVTISPGVAGANSALVSIPVDLPVGPGTYWVAVIPSVEFLTYGQTNIMKSTVGNSNAAQANPGGGFGIPGNVQSGTDNLAYRVEVDPVPEPSTLLLLAPAILCIGLSRRLRIS